MHIADYFEELYQAREGETSHSHWTNLIHQTVGAVQSTKTNEEVKPIGIDELNSTIKTLKRGKSCGPDKIPNEALIETNTKTRQIYLEMFNKIYEEEKIPNEWQEGEILRLYKGKGERGNAATNAG